MKIPLTTFTGVDQWTDMDSLKRLVASDYYYTNVEIGILVTDSPEGRPRYPSEMWIGLTLGKYSDDIKFALHICGSGARNKLKSGYYDLWLDHAPRIQVNGIVSSDELTSICIAHPHNKIITQHNDHNKSLVDLEIKVDNGGFNNSINHCMLIDASGGRGIMPSEWIMPATTKRVGFAGGLGPNEMVENLPKIIKAANGTSFWIDMEGKIRTDDKFDINKVRQVLREIDQIS